MDFPTIISIPFHNKTSLPDQYADDDVRYPEELVEYFLEKFTSKGDIILDPFTGFGTTLLVAERLGRRGHGIEIDGSKVKYLKEDLKLGNVHHSDIRSHDMESLPKIDFVMTSPPYMNKDEIEYYALSGYRSQGDYTKYLEEMSFVFTKIKSILKPNAILVIQVDNIKTNSGVTTLAWDIGKTLSEVFHFEGEIIVNWEWERKPDGVYGMGFDHSYCLVFRNS